MLGLSFVQSWFAAPANPIGVDFGTDTLRLAQCEEINGEWRLVAAGSAEVPARLRSDAAGRMNFFTESLRDLLARGNFRGRRAVLGVPAAAMQLHHIRLAKHDSDADLKKAIEWEARGRLSLDPTAALMRHVIAGEIDQPDAPDAAKMEVILMAAARERVNELLDSASRARLDVIGMNVEPKAVMDCFAHVYRRKIDLNVTNCFIDIGAVGTRAVVTRGSQVLFARSFPIGGDHFASAVASRLNIDLEDAKLLRIKRSQLLPTPEESRPQKRDVRTLHVCPSTRTDAQELSADHSKTADEACESLIVHLVAELDACRSYHQSVFPKFPIDRLIFIGGEARHRAMCQRIARELSLSAQIGDPLVRMGRLSDVGVESGIDRRLPQPSWAVAIGLSMGPRTDLEPAIQPLGAATKG